MSLTNTRRTQLDEIVQHMASNKEPDSAIQFVVDDFKAKYENESPQTQPKKGGFLRGELTGGADTSNLTGLKKFGADVFQSTLGSKGLLGVAQLPGQALGAKGALEEKASLEETRGQLYDQARNLVIKMRETTDPVEKEKLRKLSVGIDEALTGIGEASSGLEKFAPTAKQALGTTINAAATLAPISKGGKLAKAGREAVRGASFTTGGALGEDRLPSVGEVATGAVIGAVAPSVVRGATAVVNKALGITGNVGKRLLGGLGVSYEDIASNPKVAQETAEKLLSGKSTVQSVLKENSQRLLKDVQGYRSRLRSSYGKALESLSDIKLKVNDVKQAAIQSLESNGIKVSKLGINFKGAEFSTPVIKNRAIGIINEINNLKSLDGKSLSKMIQKIESLKFKTPGSEPERLAFNALMKDLGNSLSEAVAKTTPKLQAAKKAFSEGMGIVEVMEKEFGKVKFTNLSELNAFSKKVEGILTKKGISPSIIDDFFRVIGKDPSALRASEAVRGAFQTAPKAESAGINPFEFIRQVTAGLINPKDATRIAIQVSKAVNLSEQVVKPFIDILGKTEQARRPILIKSFLEIFGGQEAEEEPVESL